MHWIKEKVHRWWASVKAWWLHATGQCPVTTLVKCPRCHQFVLGDDWVYLDGEMWHHKCLNWRDSGD